MISVNKILNRIKSYKSKKIKQALNDYRNLLSRGCMKGSCEKCKYLMQIDKYKYTCKNERLMGILLPKYKREVDKIWNENYK